MERSGRPLTRSLLDRLSAADRARFCALGRQRIVEAGEELVRQGTVGDCLFVVEEGQVEVVRCIPGDEERVLMTAGPGTLLGELAVLDGGPRAASLRARQRSVMRVIRLGAFEALTLHGGEAGHRILTAVAASVHERLEATRAVSNAEGCGMPGAAARLEWAVPSAQEVALLGALRPFAAMHDLELKSLARGATVATVPRAADLVFPECESPGVILVMRGAVSPWLDAVRGPELAMPVVGPGGFVDYAAALGFASQPRWWRARSPTRLLRLDPALFRSDAEESAELLYSLSRELATTVRRATGLAMHFGMACMKPGLLDAGGERAVAPIAATA